MDEFLRGCLPDPRDVPNAEFADTFRRPTQCATDMLSALRFPAKKGSVRVDDLLREVSRSAIGTLTARVPDLARLATWLAKL